MTLIALIVVGIIGAMLLVTGVAGIIRPDRLLGSVVAVWRSKSGLAVSVGIRLILGLALLACASASALPTTFTVLGWLSIAGAVFVLLARSRIDGILDWLTDRSSTFFRLATLVGALVGGVLIYGVIPAQS